MVTRGALLLAGLAASSISAHADWEVVSSGYSNGVSSVSANRIGTGTAVVPSSGGARVVGAVTVTGPGGQAVPANLAVSIGARGVLGIAAKALPYVGLGAGLAYEVYKASRVKAGATPSSPLLHDPGQAEVPDVNTQYATRTSSNSSNEATGYFGSMGEACEISRLTVVAANPTVPVQYTRWVGQIGNQWVCRVESVNQQGQVAILYDGAYANKAVTSKVCPAYIDAWTGAHVPKGSAPGYDGKCNTGAYTVPMTAQEAADAAMAQARTASLDYAGLVREALGQGPVEIPKTDSAPAIEGSATLSGQRTETVLPNGDTQIQTEAFDLTPGISQNGQWPATATWRNKTTTVTKNPAGQVVGTTTTTTTAPGAPSSAASAPTSATDPCETDPGRLGCVGLGKVDDVDLPEQTKTLSYSADSGWGAATASCPADTTLQLHGFGAVTWSNAQACDFFSRCRPLIIAAATLAAAFIVVGGFRQ